MGPSLDYCDIESLLSPDERMVRDTARRFVDEEYLPLVREAFREGYFPRSVIPRVAALGFLGANPPEEYGCAGLNNVAYGLIMQELERGDSGLRSFASVQSGLVMFPINAYGSQEQRDYWIPKLAAGEKIGCFGLTEPDFGSNPGGMRTYARKDGDSFVLNGAKAWITNGSVADVAVVWAKIDGTVRGFLVEKGTPGFSTANHMGKFSLRASVTSQLFFEDCRIPAENVLSKTDGLKYPLSCLTQARYGIAWGVIGAAMACYDEALRYTQERVVDGGPLAGKQLTQEKLVYMLTEITKAQLLALRVGKLKDAGRLEHVMVSMIKRNNVDIALEIARKARDLLGANGIVDDYCAMRHMVNLETVRTYEGTHDMHMLILGEHVTGQRAI
jgi:glutaryl-CoA dehydrogenase